MSDSQDIEVKEPTPSIWRFNKTPVLSKTEDFIINCYPSLNSFVSSTLKTSIHIEENIAIAYMPGAKIIYNKNNESGNEWDLGNGWDNVVFEEEPTGDLLQFLKSNAVNVPFPDKFDYFKINYVSGSYIYDEIPHIYQTEEYVMNKGMTWEQWISSPYNLEHLTIDNIDTEGTTGPEGNGRQYKYKSNE